MIFHLHDGDKESKREYTFRVFIYSMYGMDGDGVYYPPTHTEKTFSIQLPFLRHKIRRTLTIKNEFFKHHSVHNLFNISTVC